MKVVFLVLAVLIVIAVGYVWYLGLFKTITSEDTIEGGFKVVGMEFTGSYSESGKAMKVVDEKLKTTGVKFLKGFGIYYDDPKTTPAEKCRSYIGNILEEKDFNKIPELKTAGFKIDSVPAASSVVAKFPLKNNLSYMIGAMKAYPALSKYMEEKKYKGTQAIEVYDLLGKQIIYIMQYNK